MNWIVEDIDWILIVSGVLTCSMIVMALAPHVAMRATFGEIADGPVANLIARSWGALIFASGLMLIYAAYHAEARLPILLYSIAGKLGFIGLVVASLPGLALSGSASAPDQRLNYAASPAPDAAIQGEQLAPYASATPAASDAGDVLGGAAQVPSAPPVAVGMPGASAAAPAPPEGPDTAKTARETTAVPSPLVLGSVALIGIGAVLLLASLFGLAPRRS